MPEKGPTPALCVRVNRIDKFNPVPPQELVNIYRHAGWLENHDGRSGDWVPGLIAGSLCCFGAFHEKRLVGFGRAISDSISDAYIQDVVVYDSFRGLGLGRRIVNAILEDLCSRNIGWIGLISAPGTAEFYRGLGFSSLSGHVPMRFTGK
ncbi:MAG TPA: N-acetyltransferase [Candidatus Aminicenantes bacterium]|nr:N-acetyltransferase [Candidatus Aminicenantes bacterium]